MRVRGDDFKVLADYKAPPSWSGTLDEGVFSGFPGASLLLLKNSYGTDPGLGQLKLMSLAAGSRRSVRQPLCLLQHFDRLFHREQESGLG